MKKAINLKDLILDSGTQVRAAIDDDTIADYAKAYKQKAKFPPVHVFVDGTKYLLADGFHRAMAADKAGLKTIEAELHSGNRADCIRFALGCNATHGLRRTNADKRRAVAIALSEFPALSNLQLSAICSVGDDLVSEIRKEMEAANDIPAVTARVSKNGDIRATPPMPRKAVPASLPMPVKAKAQLDETGHPIPSKLLALWSQAQAVQPLLTTISGLRGILRKAQEDKNPVFVRLNFTSVQSHLDMAYAELKDVKPHAVCTACQGLNPASCKLCKGLGFIGEFLWKTAVPREDKEIRMRARSL